MTREEAIAIIENEKECVNRANNCNRDCYNCELVKTDTEILAALDMAIEALEQEPKWILVSERLPVLKGFHKMSDDVLITNGYENDMGYLLKREGKIFWHYYGSDVEVGIKDEDNDVVAWMPLPEPYKTESGE